MNVKIVYAQSAETLPFEHEVVVTNRNSFTLEEIRTRFSQKMINASYFEPKKFGLKELQSFACDATSKTDWHELLAIEATGDAVTDARDISEII